MARDLEVELYPGPGREYWRWWCKKHDCNHENRLETDDEEDALLYCSECGTEHVNLGPKS
jgi:hypothetical protein